MYRTDVRNEVFFIPSPGSLVSSYFTNLDRTRGQGIETSVTNTVTRGNVMPLVPAMQLKGGSAARLLGAVRLRLDARLIGSQYLRGDEGNEQKQLDPYFLLGMRAAYAYRSWSISGVFTNVLNNHSPLFGTFNENEGTVQLERLLTPLNARAVILKLSRSFGPHGQNSEDN